MVGFAVLGCGRIGKMHARNVAAHPRARLVTVYDVARPAAEAVGSELGAKVAGSVEEALATPGVVAAFTPPAANTPVALRGRAARAGKGVLWERPIALDTARGEACWGEMGGLTPVVRRGFNRRFDPSFKALRDRLQA